MERLELFTEHRIRWNDEICAKVRQTVIDNRFKNLSGWAENGEEGYAREIDSHTWHRHDSTIQYIVPWVNQVFPLAGTKIVEVGCGTGSSTAAFAKFVDVVYGYDISKHSVEGAKARLLVHGLDTKAEFVATPPAELLSYIDNQHDDASVDIFLLFAVLEHQTIEERLETLTLAKRLVRPGGVIVICETPNRLTYFDHHTAQMPFFHMLPHDLQAIVAAQSPRKHFRTNIAQFTSQDRSRDEVEEHLTRWGATVSFHEFDLVFEDFDSRVLTSGCHPNLMKLRPEEPEEEALRQYMKAINLERHEGFTRYYLDFVIAN
ncbi:MAG: class I SAM-dependent methyltransferase [Pseudomonadota bacterium]